jgi:saccharopine dehydrogenase (NAD+, L-lysine-forming)
MARIDPIMYNGVEIVPIQFLKAVLPNPGELGENYVGETSIGCRIKGIDKEGKRRSVLQHSFVYDCRYTVRCYRDTGKFYPRFHASFHSPYIL